MKTAVDTHFASNYHVSDYNHIEREIHLCKQSLRLRIKIYEVIVLKNF